MPGVAVGVSAAETLRQACFWGEVAPRPSLSVHRRFLMLICAKCDEALPSSSMLEQHCKSIHRVVLQPSAILQCTTICVPNHHGQGVAVATTEF